MTATIPSPPNHGILSRPSDNRVSHLTDNRISHLSDERLLSRLDDLATGERRITRCILEHLDEVERRELYLKQGYSSMFSYCTKRLRYSASAANRRIRTARCIRRFPRVRELLEQNRVNLSTVSMVAGIMTCENHERVLFRIADRSQREVEAVAAGYKPRGSVRDSIKPIRVRTPVREVPERVEKSILGCEYDRSGRGRPTESGRDPGETSSTLHDVPGGDDKNITAAPSLAAVAPNDNSGGPAPAEDALPESRFVVRFAAAPDLLRQIEAARALLSFKLPARAPLAQVLGAVLGDFIERNDPARRIARRSRRKRSNSEKPKPRTNKTSPETPTPRPEQQAPRPGAQVPNPRAIPASVRDAVFANSGSRCEYVSHRGRRCDATVYLQVDHVVPVARGGTAARENLRVLCARHNRQEARRLLGKAAR